jgi:integrase
MPKRGENIRKRKDGRWEARYIAERDENGKAVYHSVYGKSYAEVKEKQKRQQLEGKRECFKAAGMSLKELLEQWLQNHKMRYKQSTYSKYKYIIGRHLAPGIGSMQVRNVNVSEINEFLGNKLQQGGLEGGKPLSPAYVRTMALILNAAFNYAAAEEFCSPLKTEIFKPAVKQPKVSTLSHREYNHLRQYCQEHLNVTSLGILIALGAGLRVGEICALRWEDVDSDNRLLCVNHTVSRISDDQGKCRWIIELPKTMSSIRVVPISDALMDALLQVRENSDSDYIVSDCKSFTNPRTFEYRYHRELSASRVTEVNFHALRHTFATRCVEGGMDIKTLSEILGHSNVGITLNTYVHSSLELKKRQVEKVERFFQERGQD